MNTFSEFNPYEMSYGKYNSSKTVTVFSKNKTTTYDTEESIELYDKANSERENASFMVALFYFLFVGGFILSCVLHFFTKSLYAFVAWIVALIVCYYRINIYNNRANEINEKLNKMPHKETIHDNDKTRTLWPDNKNPVEFTFKSKEQIQLFDDTFKAQKNKYKLETKIIKIVYIVGFIFTVGLYSVFKSKLIPIVWIVGILFTHYKIYQANQTFKQLLHKLIKEVPNKPGNNL